MDEIERWNKNVDHPLQSWEWGEFRKERQPVTRVAGMQVMWTKVPYSPWYFGYIPMGKMPNNQEIKKLIEEGKRMKAIGIRMEPNVIKGSSEKVNDKLMTGRSLFKEKTFIWDLTKTEDQLLKDMHQKGRYNIKVAQKHGVVVTEDNSDEAFDRYLDLMFSGTAKRQKIYAHEHGYHQLLWKKLRGNMAHLFVARFAGEIITADLIFRFKKNLYYAYSASALEHKEVMAPTLLLWEIARWGKQQGFEKFDLWGAEEGRGFSRFKEQFGADLVETVGSYDMPINKALYKLFRVAEIIRWKILRILK